MALSTEGAQIDAHPLTVPRNNEEPVVQLRLFNDAQRQLLQAIGDDASEADLRAHLNSTLVNITDGGNEEQGNFTEITMEDPAHGRVRREPALRDMLPRSRVYEKALEEARNNTRIKMFLLTELERDANLAEYLSQNLPDSRDFVYRVLIIAVEFGYVKLVKRLTDREGFDVNGGRRMEDFDDVYLRESGNPVGRDDETGLTNRLTPLNLAAKLGKAEIVDIFLALKSLDRALSPEGYWALYWAEKTGHAEVVDTILLNKDINAAVLMTVEKARIEQRLANDFATSFRWSKRSDIGPFCKVSLTPRQLALFYGHRNVVKLLGERLEHGTGLTNSATKMWRDEIREIVMDIPDIQKVVKRLEKERKTYVHAANSIMIVAALIGTVTFTAFLTPPPGYLDTPALNVHTFYIYNSLAFFFAILTLLIGSYVTSPEFRRTYIAVRNPVLRRFLIGAYFFLYCSVTCLIITFVKAGYIVLPPFKVYNISSVTITSICAVIVVVTGLMWVSFIMNQFTLFTL